MAAVEIRTAERRIAQAEDMVEQDVENFGVESEEALKATIALGEAHCYAGFIQKARIAFESALECLEQGMVNDLQLEKVRILRNLAFVFSVLEMPNKEWQTWERIVEIQKAMGDVDMIASVELLADCVALHGSRSKALELLDEVEAFTGEPNLRKRVIILRKKNIEAGKLLPNGTPQLDSESLIIDGAARFFGLLLRSNPSSPLELVGGTLMLRQAETCIAPLMEMQEYLASNSVSDLQKMEKIIKATSDAFGSESIQTAQWMYLLAKLFGSRGDYSARKEILVKVLRIQEKTFGFDSFFIVPTLKGLAHCEGELGNQSSKIDHLRRALELQEEELGAQHKRTCTTKYFLEETCEEQHRSRDPEGTKNNLFGRERSVMVGEARLVAERTPLGGVTEPFHMVAHGGGSCAFNEEAGIRVPFYFGSD